MVGILVTNKIWWLSIRFIGVAIDVVFIGGFIFVSTVALRLHLLRNIRNREAASVYVQVEDGGRHSTTTKQVTASESKILGKLLLLAIISAGIVLVSVTLLLVDGFAILTQSGGRKLEDRYNDRQDAQEKEDYSLLADAPNLVALVVNAVYLYSTMS